MEQRTIKLLEKRLSESWNVAHLIFSLDQPLSFKEGQFVMLEKELDWKKVLRSYSIASTNKQWEEGIIEFIVKKASENGMSHYLTQVINIWDELQLKWPLWHLTLVEHNKYFLISTWSWLGPIHSLYKKLIKEENFQWKAVNLYWERSTQELITGFKDIFSENNENTKNIFYLSQEESEWFNKGYIQWGIDEALAFLWSTDIRILICGKPVMVDEVKALLIEKWVAKEHIKLEKY